MSGGAKLEEDMQDYAGLPLLKNTTTLHALAGLNGTHLAQDQLGNVALYMNYPTHSSEILYGPGNC